MSNLERSIGVLPNQSQNAKVIDNVMNSSTVVTASDWTKGISLSVLASVIGGASKLAIRKSWLLEQELERIRGEGEDCDDDNNNAFDDGGQRHRDAMDANDAESILVTAVSTLSQEEDDGNEEDEALEQPGSGARAIDSGGDGVQRAELLVEMSARQLHVRRHSTSSRAAAAH